MFLHSAEAHSVFPKNKHPSKPNGMPHVMWSFIISCRLKWLEVIPFSGFILQNINIFYVDETPVSTTIFPPQRELYLLWVIFSL